MINALFVYGTLCPGRENEGLLRAIEGTFEKASVRGIHFPDGWIDGFPYPGIKLDENGEEITGYVFTSSNLYKHWGRLDAFEGSNYQRVSTTAVSEKGELISVYVYVIKV